MASDILLGEHILWDFHFETDSKWLFSCFFFLFLKWSLLCNLCIFETAISSFLHQMFLNIITAKNQTCSWSKFMKSPPEIVLKATIDDSKVHISIGILHQFKSFNYDSTDPSVQFATLQKIIILCFLKSYVEVGTYDCNLIESIVLESQKILWFCYKITV